jgi:epoxide hydrolase-like predicted phosphatase
MTSDRGIRALLVDYGGVMTSSVTTSFVAFCLATGVKPETLKALLADAYADGDRGLPSRPSLAHLVVAVETGAMSGEEFDRQLAPVLSEGLDTAVDPTGLTARLFGGVRPDDAMIEAVRTARRAGLKTGLISNTWGTVRPTGTDGLFDAQILSGEVRLRKPQPEIYLLAADRLGVEPEACVFVDDLPANVEGARAVGMEGVLHRDGAITIPKLEELLGVTLSL